MELREKALAIRQAKEYVLKLRKVSKAPADEFINKYTKSNPQVGEFAS